MTLHLHPFARVNYRTNGRKFGILCGEGRILIANLGKGRIGEEASCLLGSLLVTKLQLAAMGRANVAEEERRDFFLHVDEFPTFVTRSFTGLLAEARKYRLSLTLGHQYLEQVEEAVKASVLGNVGTMSRERYGAPRAVVEEKVRRQVEEYWRSMYSTYVRSILRFAGWIDGLWSAATRNTLLLIGALDRLESRAHSSRSEPHRVKSNLLYTVRFAECTVM